MTDDDPMPFGKWKGTKMEEVPASYLDWLRDQEWIDQWPEVRNYIDANRDAINLELEPEET